MIRGKGTARVDYGPSEIRSLLIYVHLSCGLPFISLMVIHAATVIFMISAGSVHPYPFVCTKPIPTVYIPLPSSALVHCLSGLSCACLMSCAEKGQTRSDGRTPKVMTDILLVIL